MYTVDWQQDCSQPAHLETHKNCIDSVDSLTLVCFSHRSRTDGSTLLAVMVKAYEGALILADICLLLVKILFWILEAIYRIIVPLEEKSVAGEIVLITGTGHGIGRELALKYASLGATVVCWDVNSQGNQETINEIKKIGATTAHAYQCDIADRDQVFQVAKKVKDEVGNVTILVNNAGIMPCHTFLETSVEEIKKIIDINLLGQIWLLQAFLPSMIAKNSGHIVAISSMAGVLGVPNLVPYCASKFAVRGLMEALGEELRSNSPDQVSNIKTTTIYPYMVNTGLCKKPRMRFPSLMSLVTPQDAASQIITAQRRNHRDVSVPKYWLTVNAVLRVFPEKVALNIKEFLECGVDAD